jgi:hypothetical protein
MGWGRRKAAVVAGIALLATFTAAAAVDDGDLPLIANPFDEPQLEEMTRSGPPLEVHERPIQVAENLPGMQSYLLHAPIRQPARTYGPGFDTVRATFDRAVDVHGLSASVDVSATLFELEAGINKANYGGNSPGWLFHYTSEASEKIDEAVMFPHPFRLKSSDYLSLTAWIYNGSSVEAVAQPEVIVYFTPA